MRFFNSVGVRWRLDSAELFLLFWRALPQLSWSILPPTLNRFFFRIFSSLTFTLRLKCVQSRAFFTYLVFFSNIKRVQYRAGFCATIWYCFTHRWNRGWCLVSGSCPTRTSTSLTRGLRRTGTARRPSSPPSSSSSRGWTRRRLSSLKRRSDAGALSWTSSGVSTR